MSKAHRFTSDEAVRAFLERQREEEQPCEYDHLRCSDVKGGTCMDELLGLFPHIAEEES